MLFWILTQVALASPCADLCEQKYTSCASVSAAGCGVAGAAAEKAAGKALGGLPGGAFLSKSVGAKAKSICAEKLAPCNDAKTQCLAACSEATGPAGLPAVPARAVASPAATPAPLLIFGDASGASIWIDGMRAGVLPRSSTEPYTSPPLLPGPHTVRVEDAQGASWEKRVTISVGVINSVEVGALRSEQDRQLAAAVLLDEQGKDADALVAFSSLAELGTDPEVVRQARAAVDRLVAAREAEALDRSQRHARAAENEWKRVLVLSSDRWAQRARAATWLDRYPDTEHASEATQLIQEIDALVDAHLAGALASIRKYEYEFEAEPGHEDRVRASQAVLRAQGPAEENGLGPYLERRATESGVWVDAEDRRTRYTLWRAEQRRSHTGRSWLIFASFGTAAAAPMLSGSTDAEDLREIQLALVGANMAAGAGMIAIVESRHARLNSIYGKSMPTTGRMPGVAAPLITIGTLQLATFQFLKVQNQTSSSYLDCYGSDCPTIDDWMDEQEDDDWETARELNLIGLNGWLNVALGVATIGLHHGGRFAGRVHLSPTGLHGTF
jgi:hypothetical protein